MAKIEISEKEVEQEKAQVKSVMQRIENKSVESDSAIFGRQKNHQDISNQCHTLNHIEGDSNHEDCSQRSNLNTRIEELEKEVSRIREEATSLRRVVENRNLELQAARTVKEGYSSKRST